MRKLIVLCSMQTAFLLSQSAWSGQIVVPAGAFQMGCSRSDAACEKDEGPPGGVRVQVPASPSIPTRSR
jgi:hypothetical protein